MNKIVIAGGAGSLIKVLVQYFLAEGAEVVVLSRSIRQTKNNLRFVEWDGLSLGAWVAEMENADVVINLAGKTINCRHTKDNKKEIISSRINATTIIGKAIQECKYPPKLWINASSAAIYINTGEAYADENTSHTDDFTANVSKQWESAFYEVQTPHTRKIALRIGVVLTAKGGMLEPLFKLAKYWLVGTAGSGKQYISWIHENDFVKLIRFFMTNENISGSINMCTPNSVTNKQFMAAIRKACSVPVNLPAPAFFVKVAAFFMGTEPELILGGRKVISNVIKATNFSFQFPTVEEAIQDIASTKKQL